MTWMVCFKGIHIARRAGKDRIILFSNTGENQKGFSLYFHKMEHHGYNPPTAIADDQHSVALALITKKLNNEKSNTDFTNYLLWM